MKEDAVIDQLKELRNYCEDFVDKENPDCVWSKDIAALNFAIKAVKKTCQDGNPSRS